jgi:RNA polymerase sigma-70 factor (ECF subfamily)
MSTRAFPARHLVAVDGLAGLRRAVVLAGVPAPRGAVTAGILLRAASTSTVTSGRSASPSRSGSPRIPVPSPPAEPTDEQQAVVALVSAAQAGDGEAFGQLYDRYVDMVHRYIAYRVSNVSLAEDLTSETFLRALRRIGSFTWQGRDFGAWLVTIARNLIADHFKSSRYKLEIATSDLVAAGADRRQDGPEDEVLAGFTSAALLDAVKQLGPEQQECIALRFLQGMSVAETAAVLGKNTDAVKALQYRAVKALARALPRELVA